MNTATLTRMTAAITRKQTGPAPWMRISSASVDRDHDTVNPSGGDFSAVARGNLPLVWGHNYQEVPIGKVTKVWTEANHVCAEWRWLEHDPLADRVRNAWDQNIITAASIGFLPTDSVRNKAGGRDHLCWELLEVSLCVVPSNRDAVRELKALGLWSTKEASMHSNQEIDLTPEQLRQIPGLVRDSVDAEFRKYMTVQQHTRPDEIDLDDAQVRRILADFPAIVDAAIATHIQQEVALGLRRAAGRLD